MVQFQLYFGKLNDSVIFSSDFFQLLKAALVFPTEAELTCPFHRTRRLMAILTSHCRSVWKAQATSQ